MTETEVKNGENGSTPAQQKTEVSELEGGIIRQLEYYFGDANMARDKFLTEQCAKDSGWVPIDVLLTFKRLKSLSEDKKVIADAIEKSDEGLIEVSEDREKLRRHPERPLPEQNEETRKDIYSRTIYVKGFPPQDATGMDDLLKFFAPYDKIQNIVMRKYHDKPTKKYLFKGSVFVTFQTKEQAAEFLAVEKLEYNDVPLIRKWQDDYFEEKKAEKNKRSDKKKAADIKIDHFPKAASLRMDAVPKEIPREDIKEAILKVDESIEIAYIDFQKNDESGFIRMATENAGKELLEKLENNTLKINDDADVKLRLLEGDEEVEFLKKVVLDQQARRQSQRQNKKYRGKQGGGNRKRRAGGDDDDEPPKKK